MKGTLHSCSLLCLVEGQRLFIVSAGSNQERGAGSNELAGRGVHTQPRALACISYRLMSGTHHRSATHADHHHTALGIPSAVQRPTLPAHSHTYACMHACKHAPTRPSTYSPPPFHTAPPPLVLSGCSCPVGSWSRPGPARQGQRTDPPALRSQQRLHSHDGGTAQ
jgi:hypothetical protein